MDNETPLQKQKLKEFNEILETPDPQVEKKNPPIPTAGSTENKENRSSENNSESFDDLLRKRIAEEISAFVNFQGFLYSTLDSLGLPVEKNDKAIEEYKNVIQNNVIEQFQTGNIDWRFYSNVINNKMSLWIGGIYLVAMPVVKAVNEKRKLNKEKMKDDLENIPDPKSKQKDNKTSKQNFSEGSLKDNISKQYN
jgi:hypothetical protein